VYLNNAATTYPKPKVVLDAVKNSLVALPFENSRSNLDSEDIIIRCKTLLAEFIGADSADEIFFTSGATESANLIIHGLDLKNSHVIVSSTEHNAVLRPLYNHFVKPVISQAVCGDSGEVIVQEIERLIQPNTRVIFLSHCSGVTGYVQDIESIGKLAHERGIIFVVDASQSIGCIDIDVLKMNIDILIFTGHKNLFGLAGIGGMYIKRDVPVVVVKTGGTGYDSDLIKLPKNYRNFEPGTPNFIGITSLMSGLMYLESVGIVNIERYVKSVRRAVLTRLNKLKNVTLYNKDTEKLSGPVVSLNIDGLSPTDVGYILRETYGIIVRTGLHCCPVIHKNLSTPHGTVRMSYSLITPKKDIEAFVNAIEQLSVAI